MRIPVDITGDILNSPRAEHQVRVADDAENTGGYLVCEWWVESDGPNLKGAFDSWVERSELQRFFRDSAWQVKWHDTH